MIVEGNDGRREMMVEGKQIFLHYEMLLHTGLLHMVSFIWSALRDQLHIVIVNLCGSPVHIRRKSRHSIDRSIVWFFREG